jgi:hypothetical protein
MADHADVSQAALAELLDKQAIAENLYRYCRGLDRLDWELVRSCYHDDAIDEHGGFRGGPDEFVENYREAWARDIECTMHSISNLLINIRGDVAASEAHVRGWYRLVGQDDAPTRDMIVQARYVDQLERRDGKWKILYRRAIFEHSRLEPDPVEWSEDQQYDSEHRAETAAWGRRDRRDVSYPVLAFDESTMPTPSPA